MSTHAAMTEENLGQREGQPEPNSAGTFGGGAALGATPCSRLSDLLPPPDVIEAAEKVRVWMETNGYQNWQLAGVCDRRIAEQRDQMEAALMLAAQWGIASDQYSAEVASQIRCWIIGGMKGPAPKAHDYYSANDPAEAQADE